MYCQTFDIETEFHLLAQLAQQRSNCQNQGGGGRTAVWLNGLTLDVWYFYLKECVRKLKGYFLRKQVDQI